MSISYLESISTIERALLEHREDLIKLLKLVLVDLKEANCNSQKQYITERPTFRFKSAESVYEKISRKNLDINDFSNSLKDLLGIRAICLDLSSVNKVTEKLLGSSRIEVIEQKRWIETSDDDGYRGIHLIFTARNKELLKFKGLKVEIQIRTVAQHFWASFSHRDIYKSKRILLSRTSDRMRALSDTLYQSDKELERLESEIKDNPLALNPLSLQSLLKHFGYNIEPSEVDLLYNMIRENGLGYIDIPTIQTAIFSGSNEIDMWIQKLYEVILKSKPQMTDTLFCYIYTCIHGLYWPKRKLLVWVLNQVKESWSDILGNDHAEDMIILFEAATKDLVTKYIYTLTSPDKSNITWSSIIDNRYTTKRLMELGLIKAEFQENIINQDTPTGLIGKHAYRIKCTAHGLEIASTCMNVLFGKTDCKHILKELETEDFPDYDQLNFGLPKSVDICISTESKDEGPIFAEKEWWSGNPGYY